MVDPIFANRRLAQVYDPLDLDRSDLDAYVAMVAEFGARSVLDIGCGTGTFACLLANRALSVTAVDPAAASLELARTKPGADRVRWIHGYAAELPPLAVDLATMTGNVAQVFLTDHDWAATLRATSTALPQHRDRQHRGQPVPYPTRPARIDQLAKQLPQHRGDTLL